MSFTMHFNRSHQSDSLGKVWYFTTIIFLEIYENSSSFYDGKRPTNETRIEHRSIVSDATMHHKYKNYLWVLYFDEDRYAGMGVFSD